MSRAQKTITKPATSQETEDAIEAPLLLRTMGMPPPQPEDTFDDNEVLMPIGVNQATDDSKATITVLAMATTNRNPPKPGTVLGVAVKLDQGGESSKPENQEQKQTDSNNKTKGKSKSTAEADNQEKNGKNNKKKTFVTRQFGLKRRNRPWRKFKCEKCDQELNTVHDYNQHYLDNHPRHHARTAHDYSHHQEQWPNINTVTQKLCTSVRHVDVDSPSAVSIYHIARST